MALEDAVEGEVGQGQRRGSPDEDGAEERDDGVVLPPVPGVVKDATGAFYITDRTASLNDEPSYAILLDPTGYSCDERGAGCTDAFGAPRLDPPLREQLMRRTSAGVSALLLPYLSPHGQHSFSNPKPDKAFDMDQFMANLIGRYFETRGRELRFERCQAGLHDCPWIPAPPP